MFKFKGISSDDMKVVVEEEQHFLAKAQQRIETTSIDGRDGDIIDFLGYSNIERPIKVQMLDSNKLDDILSWLNGSGVFEYQNRITTAYFYQAVEPIRTSSIKIADLMFSRDPFWYKKDDEFVVVTDKIMNSGNVYSKPVIRLEKGTSDVVELTIANVRFKYTFSNDETYVEIDCENMNAFYNGLMRNNLLEIGYDFPILNVGENSIVINSGDPVIKVKRKDRWL